MRKLVAIAALLASQMFAGGFWLQLGDPNGAIKIKAVGCHDPATAQVTATAIGMAEGRRQSIPLKVTPLAEAGTFELSQQWPKEGRWVIQLVGRNGEQFTNSLVPVTAKGIDRAHVKMDMKPFTDSDVAAMLQ